MSAPGVKNPNDLNAETAREFLVAALGDVHEQHTVVSKQTDRKTIGFVCSCRSSIEFWLAEPMGKRAVVALRNVPEEK